VETINQGHYNTEDLVTILQACRDLAYSLNEGRGRTEDRYNWNGGTSVKVPTAITTPSIPDKLIIGVYNKTTKRKWNLDALIHERYRPSSYRNTLNEGSISIVDPRKLYEQQPMLALAQAAEVDNVAPTKLVEQLCVLFGGWFRAPKHLFGDQFLALARTLTLRYTERLTRAQRKRKLEQTEANRHERLESMKDNLRSTRREIAYYRRRFEAKLEQLEAQEATRVRNLERLAAKLGVSVDIDSL
jgi:hypothetical protein